MKRKCIFVIGPESSGTTLIARICAAALGIRKFGDWNGNGCCESSEHKVCHRSLPYEIPPLYPDIQSWVEENRDKYNLYFVLATRDITISESSRIERFLKSNSQVGQESKKAANIMKSIIGSEHEYYIWSYETFMFLGKDYLKLLYKFIDIESEFMPDISDGNRERIIQRRIRTRPPTWLERKLTKGLKSIKRRLTFKN